MKSTSKKKNKQKRGQTSVEYILIIGVIVGVIMLFGKTFREKIAVITDEPQTIIPLQTRGRISDMCV
jgi:uncharacterized protein (UPF0333 family)